MEIFPYYSINFTVEGYYYRKQRRGESCDYLLLSWLEQTTEANNNDSMLVWNSGSK